MKRTSLMTNAGDCVQAHGSLQSLCSPVLSKVNQGFTCYKEVVTGRASAKYTAFHTREGTNGSTVSAGWQSETQQLDIIFRAVQYKQFVGRGGWGQARSDQLTTPAWLLQLAPEAKAVAFALEELNQFIAPKNGQDNLGNIITKLTGGVQIRRIQMVGFCVGGSMATLAATWAAVQWPTADVRCITFGTLAIGNTAFVSAFRWLVSLSYRVTFRRDPIPSESTQTASHKLKHVHGAIYMSEEAMQPGPQPQANVKNLSMGDHTPEAYAQALNATCQKTLDREHNTGGVCRAQIDMSSLYQHALTAVDKYTQHLSSRSGPHLSSHLQQDRLSYANEDGTSADFSSNTRRARIRAGVGSLALDVTQLARAALARASLACRGLGRRKSASNEVLVLSQDMRGVPSLRASTEVTRRRDSVLNSAQQHLHAALKASGLETADQSGFKHLRRVSCRSRSGSLGLTPQASQVLADTDAAPYAALEDSDDSAKLVLQAIQYAVESAYSGLTAMPQSTVQGSVSAEACQDAQSARASYSATLTSTLHNQTGTAQHPEAAHKSTHAAESASPPCAGVPSQSAVPTRQYTAASISSSPQHAAVQPDPHMKSSHGYTANAQSQGKAECMTSRAGDVSSSSPATACSSNTGQQDDGSRAPGCRQFARESEDLDDPGSNPRREAMEACNAALAGGYPSSLDPKAFNMLERDSCSIQPSELNDLQKVLIFGKISQAAAMARCAYRDQATFQQQTGISNSRLIHARQHHDTKVHVGWLQGGTAVFAFRGTATRQDGLQDVKIFSRNVDYLQEMYPGVKAHLGFLQQLAAVCHPDRPDLNMAAVLRELSGGQTPTRVICCGHSLGGALATLGATWAALEYPDADVRCISFGSPRVANKAFGRAFSALVGTSLRLVHGFDPVPALPPSMMYKHVERPIHIQQQELVLKARPWHAVLRSCVSHHSMLSYIHGIYRHMPGGLDLLPGLSPPCSNKPVNPTCLAQSDTGKEGKPQMAAAKQAGLQTSSKTWASQLWSTPVQACLGRQDFAVPDTAIAIPVAS